MSVAGPLQHIFGVITQCGQSCYSPTAKQVGLETVKFINVKANGYYAPVSNFFLSQHISLHKCSQMQMLLCQDVCVCVYVYVPLASIPCCPPVDTYASLFNTTVEKQPLRDIKSQNFKIKIKKVQKQIYAVRTRGTLTTPVSGWGRPLLCRRIHRSRLQKPFCMIIPTILVPLRIMPCHEKRGHRQRVTKLSQ